MEIYEADSRINAAACRTAFRAMGRAFFRTGRGRSWPHFTINVLFFRLFRCVPFLTDSAASQTAARISRRNRRTAFFHPAAISGCRAKVRPRSTASDGTSRLAECRAISSRARAIWDTSFRISSLDRVVTPLVSAVRAAPHRYISREINV